GKSLMELPKAPLTSPSLRTRLPPLPAADNPAVAASHARDRLVRTQGFPTDTLASRHCSPAPTHVAHEPDCPGSRHHPAASRAPSPPAEHPATLPSRNPLDQEPAAAAEMPCRTRHIAAPPSMRLRPSQPGRVRYRPAVNGLVTNSRKRRNYRWRSIQWAHS